MSAADMTGRSLGARLERADYMGPHGDRRVILEYDYPRAAQGLYPWRVRCYVLRPHATTETGTVWKLARRRYHRPSVAAALAELRPWLAGGIKRLTSPRVHRPRANNPEAPLP